MTIAKPISVPAVSRELEFVARNARIVQDLLDNGKPGPLVELTETVNTKAAVDADRILRKFETDITDAASGILRIEWANTNRGDYWEPWARIFMPRGPKRRIGSLGLVLGHSKMALRLTGWIWPRWGGLDGRQELARVCAKKVAGVCLPYETSKYPGWTEDDGVVWFDSQLSLRRSLDDVRSELRSRAKVFLKAARPVLEDLSRR